MFDCCRVPGSNGLDWAVSYAKKGDTGDSGHVVVLRKNRVWKIDIARDDSIISTGDLERYVYDLQNQETRRSLPQTTSIYL